jgi:molecular chaperone GrpE
MTKKKTENYLSDLKRVQADFVNYKKRVEEDKKNWLKFANVGLITKLIPVLDNFKRAGAHLPEDLKDNEFVKGVMAIEKQFERIMEEEGVEKIETKDQAFDPKWHEVMFYEVSELPEGQIIEELEAGYRLGDSVIKPSKVKVSKGPSTGSGQKGEKNE